MALDPHLNLQLARARAEQLRRDAGRGGGDRASRFSRQDVPPAHASIVIRPDRAEDGRALARLAALDCARVPAAPLLVGEVAGELRAALSLTDGATIADPFHRTASLVDLLNMRARQLQGEPPRDRRVLGRLRRWVTRVRRLSAPAS
jgi:hypothetical protein